MKHCWDIREISNSTLDILSKAIKRKGDSYKSITSQVKLALHSPQSPTARRLKVTLLQLVGFELRHCVMT